MPQFKTGAMRPGVPCARYILGTIITVSLAVGILGSIADHWHQLMRTLSFGFWGSLALAVASAASAIWIACATLSHDSPPFSTFGVPTASCALAGSAVLLLCASDDARTSTRALAVCSTGVFVFLAVVPALALAAVAGLFQLSLDFETRVDEG
jgi:hypothetical protein